VIASESFCSGDELFKNNQMTAVFAGDELFKNNPSVQLHTPTILRKNYKTVRTYEMSYEITIVNLKRDEHCSECLANFTYSSTK
jgi:hypothetical protein